MKNKKQQAYKCKKCQMHYTIDGGNLYTDGEFICYNCLDKKTTGIDYEELLKIANERDQENEKEIVKLEKISRRWFILCIISIITNIIIVFKELLWREYLKKL